MLELSSVMLSEPSLYHDVTDAYASVFRPSSGHLYRNVIDEYAAVFRPSSGHLLNALRDGVLALNAEFTDYGKLLLAVLLTFDLCIV